MKKDSREKVSSDNQTASANKPRLKGVLIFLAMILVLVSFIIYGVDVFYPAPEYDDFCGDVPFQLNVESCDDANVTEYGTKDCYCNEFEGCMRQNPQRTQCQERYNEADDKYELAIFIIMTLIGGALIFGSFFIRNPIVSNSIMAGGVVVLFIGVVRGWNNFGEAVRFIMLGAILAMLIWITVKKLGDN